MEYGGAVGDCSSDSLGILKKCVGFGSDVESRDWFRGGDEVFMRGRRGEFSSISISILSFHATSILPYRQYVPIQSDPRKLG